MLFMGVEVNPNACFAQIFMILHILYFFIFAPSFYFKFQFWMVSFMDSVKIENSNIYRKIFT